MAGDFNQRPLEHDTIRLIKFDSLSSDPTEPITCILEHANFHPDRSPVYFALSYCWGKPTDLNSITINGQHFSVTQNLHHFLHRIRVHAPHFRRIVCQDLGLQSWDMWLWVDALCINQKDKVEKSRLIPQMGQIYSSAYNVLIWLDSIAEPAGDLSPPHLNLLFHHAHKAFPIDPVFQQTATFESLDNAYAARIAYDTRMLFYTALKIVWLAWFKRMWVVQEYVLSARKPWALLGAGVFTLEGLSDVVNRVVPQLIGEIEDESLRNTVISRRNISKYDFTNVAFTIHVSSRVRSPEFMSWTFAERLLFFFLHLRHRVCSEPHDYIYGLLGAVGIPPPIELLGVNYDCPFGQVCHNYAGYLCEQTGNLAILGSVKRHEGYASWIPDFSDLRAGPPSLHPLTRSSVSWNPSAQELSVEGAYLSALTKYFQFEDGTAGQIERFYDDVLASAALLQQRPLQSVFDDWITPFVKSFGSDSLDLSMRQLIELAQQYCGGKWLGMTRPEDESAAQAGLFMFNFERFLKTGSFAVEGDGEMMFVQERDLVQPDEKGVKEMTIWAMKGTKHLTILRHEIRGYRYMGWCFPLRGLIFPTPGLDLDDEYFEGQTVQRITLI